MDRENKIFDLSFKFAVDIINLYKFLSKNNEYILSKQLLRSGTSIGANVNEAQAAQSKKDFVAKMSIASKEARETCYWIKLLKETDYLSNYAKFDEIFKDINSIINILSKIVKTSQENLNKKC